MTSQGVYILYGSHVSYATAKSHSYLRKKGIPFVERAPESRDFANTCERPARTTAFRSSKPWPPKTSRRVTHCSKIGVTTNSCPFG